MSRLVSQNNDNVEQYHTISKILVITVLSFMYACRWTIHGSEQNIYAQLTVFPNSRTCPKCHRKPYKSLCQNLEPPNRFISVFPCFPHEDGHFGVPNRWHKASMLPFLVAKSQLGWLGVSLESGARMEPIQIAVENADLDIALLLMKYGADVGQISDGTAKDGKNIQQFLRMFLRCQWLGFVMGILRYSWDSRKWPFWFDMLDI